MRLYRHAKNTTVQQLLACHAVVLPCRMLSLVADTLPVSRDPVTPSVVRHHYTSSQVQHCTPTNYSVVHINTISTLQVGLYCQVNTPLMLVLHLHALEPKKADAMHSAVCADYAVARCPSVCPSVCPSHAGILSKRLNISSNFSHHR